MLLLELIVRHGLCELEHDYDSDECRVFLAWLYLDLWRVCRFVRTLLFRDNSIRFRVFQRRKVWPTNNIVELTEWTVDVRGEYHGQMIQHEGKTGGQLRLDFLRTYRHGKSHGVWKSWYNDIDNTLYCSCTYKNGFKEGVEQYWNKDGTLSSQHAYERGRLIALATT